MKYREGETMLKKNAKALSDTPQKNSSSSSEASPSSSMLDLQMVNGEISGILLVIFAYLIILAASLQLRQTLLQQQAGMKPASNSPTPSEMISGGAWIILFATILLAEISFARLDQKAAQASSGQSEASLTPFILIADGYKFSIIANILRAVGAQQIANASQQVVL